MPQANNVRIYPDKENEGYTVVSWEYKKIEFSYSTPTSQLFDAWVKVNGGLDAFKVWNDNPAQTGS